MNGDEFAACFDLDYERLQEALAGSGSAWHWNVVERPLRIDQPMTDGWPGAIRLDAPPYPADQLPEVVRQVLATCDGLAALVTEIVAHGTVCSPWQVGREVGARDYTRVPRLARALSVFARDQVRRGDGVGAIRLLLDGMRLMQDLRRERVNLVSAMVSVAGTAIVVSEAQTLLALELGLSDADIDAFRTELDALVATEPHPLDVLEGESIYYVDQYLRAPFEAPGWAPPGGWDPEAQMVEEELVAATIVGHQSALSDLGRACPRTSTGADCLEGLRALAATPVPASVPQVLQFVLGPRVDYPAIVGAVQHGVVDMMPNYIARLLGALVMYRGLRAIAGFHARRRAGSCPGVGGFTQEDLNVPSIGSLTAFELAEDQQFELHAPEILAEERPVNGTLPLLLTLCPGLEVAEAGTFEPR
jgi:hypothetical protein